MFATKTTIATVVLLIAVVMTTIPARVAADRSFYAPGPVNYPGLLPRFGGGNDALAARSAAGATRGGGDGDSLGTRFGERDDDSDRNQRLRPSGSSAAPSSSGCQQLRVPCYDCIVYISRTGQITRFNPARQNDLVPY